MKFQVHYAPRLHHVDRLKYSGDLSWEFSRHTTSIIAVENTCSDGDGMLSLSQSGQKC